jgi:hypothetical protein
MITAFRQCLSRMPSPENLRKEMQDYGRKLTATTATEVGLRLAQLQLNINRNGEMVGTVLEEGPIQQLVGHPVLNKERQLTGFRFLPLDAIRPLLLQTAEYAAVELGGLDEANRKQLFEQLKNMTKQVEDRLRVQMDAFKRETGQAVKPTERFRRARQFELPSEAITVLKSMPGAELLKEFGPESVPVLLQLVAYEMCLGRLEDAAADLAELKEAFNDLTRGLEPGVANTMRQVLRVLEQQKLLLEGDYAGAGAELEGLEGKGVGLEPILAQLSQQRFNPIPFTALSEAWPAIPMLGAYTPFDLTTMYWHGYMQFQAFMFYREVLARKMPEDAGFFFRRGMLSLIEGDISAAKERFRQTRRTAPPGWSLPHVQHATAESYLRMIEAAEKK